MSDLRTHHDVVVVGARAAGAATALLLARRGHRVLVLDRTAHGSDTLSTHALMRGGVLQLHRWGLLDRIRAAGSPPVRRAVFRVGGSELDVPVKARDGVDALYAPRRTLLDRVLVDAAVEAGAEVRFGVTVTGVRAARDRVGGVTWRAADGRTGTAGARLTVGADGVRSAVARHVGAATERSGTAATGFVFGYFPGVGGDAYEWAFAPGVAAGVIPTDGDLGVVFVGVPSSRFRREVAGRLEQAHRQILAEASPALAARIDGLRAVGPLRGFPGVPAWVRTSHGPGWALVGDAGYWKDPIGAHGISAALRDAEGLARAIDDGLGGRRPEAAALAAYQRDRDRMSDDLFRVTDEMAGFGWDERRIQELLGELSAAARPELEALLALDAPAPPLARTA